MPVSRFTLALVVASCGLLGAATPTTASPGGLKVLVTGNCDEYRDNLATAIRAQPGIASVTAFDTSAGTPTGAQLAARDLVVSIGDCEYFSAATFGNRLANYVDHGGAVLQAAYDNWDSDDASPTGRFASGGYAPLSLGPADNHSVTLGTVLKPNSPIVKGLGTFPNSDNTTTPLAAGATLLAKWSDDRNAIAVKGRVVATSASADESEALPDMARLARNTANYFNLVDTKITNAIVNSGKSLAAFRFKAVVGSPSGFKCQLKKVGGHANFKPCSSPKRYTNLAPGKYVFQVKAVGFRHADPTPARKRFAINS